MIYIRAFILLCLFFLQPVMASTLRVGVMTMQPGEQFWERFGHNAIVIDDGKQAISYNFGFFDMDEPGFTGNFIRGKMNYLLVALPLQQDLQYYQQTGRGVSIQWLKLNAEQIARVNSRLQFLARPENARYRYDYFQNNCATQVRDVIDLALDGELQKTLSASSFGNTYRSESVRLAWPAKWMALGFDVLLGKNADTKLNRWQDAYIPMQLHDSLRIIRAGTKNALIDSEQTLVTHRLSLANDEPPLWTGKAMLIGIFLAVMFYFSARNPKLFYMLSGLFWLLMGMVGCLLLALHFGTEHRFVHFNENVFLFSPLGLVASMLLAFKNKSTALNKLFIACVKLIALSVLLLAFYKLMPFSTQQNWPWLVLLLPVHWIITRTILQQNTHIKI